MAQLTIPDMDEAILKNLEHRASANGTSPAAEARLILQEALEPRKQTAWNQVNDFRARLAASGRTFTDSTDLIREDRGR